VDANIRNRTRAQAIAAIIVFLVVIGSFAAIFTGKALAGLATLVLAAAALASRFLGTSQGNGGEQVSLPPPMNEEGGG